VPGLRACRKHLPRGCHAAGLMHPHAGLAPAGAQDHAGAGRPEGAGGVGQRGHVCAVLHVAAAGEALCMLPGPHCLALLGSPPLRSQVAPGITPTLLERIVAARTDLTKADIKEVWPCHRRQRQCPLCCAARRARAWRGRSWSSAGRSMRRVRKPAAMKWPAMSRPRTPSRSGRPSTSRSWLQSAGRHPPCIISSDNRPCGPGYLCTCRTHERCAPRLCSQRQASYRIRSNEV